MKTKILLSLVATTALYAADVNLGVIKVIEEAHTEVVDNVSGDQVKSADLAEALYREIPSVNMIRRSAIANDIVLRGQKRDNIAFTIDDAKVFGACPNRMDPPSSHVLTSNIGKVTVSEGPFDVTTFGTLSGSVKVETVKPKEGFSGDLYFNVGSFNYQKAGATIKGGSQNFKYLITASTESSDQYEDGEGASLATQIFNATDGTAQANLQLQDRYSDIQAFEKDTFMSKFFMNFTDNQELELSYTLNRSDNVLYANSGMDALYDDSDIVNLRYTAKGLGKWSKKFQIKAYNSKVDHPMSNEYRVKADTAGGLEDSNERMISALTTNTSGIKLINDTELTNATLTTGLDTSIRNWDGTYTKYGTGAAMMTGRKSINDVDTTNMAAFFEYSRKMDKLKLTVGTRFNDTTVSTLHPTYTNTDRTFNSVDANVRATYKTNKKTSYFFGLGQASRVPDARELYFSEGSTLDTVLVGTPTLNMTTNREIDLGYSQKYDNGAFKIKVFYSMLEDYIYYRTAANKVNAFSNIDATIYGIEVKSRYDLSDSNYFKLGATYKRGQKDEAVSATELDKDLADITPLKATLSFNHEPDDYTHYKVELVAADAWDNYDEDNGEQRLSGYGVVNLKAKKTFKKKYEVIVGIDNVSDKTYAISNTYADLTLLGDGSTNEVMLLNEPGRYLYMNLKYKF